nr:uncharacterized protein LOC127299242 isoform X2 [Lolium perenne]
MSSLASPRRIHGGERRCFVVSLSFWRLLGRVVLFARRRWGKVVPGRLDTLGRCLGGGLTLQSPAEVGAEIGKGAVRALRLASGKRPANLERGRQVRGMRDGFISCV